MIKSVGNTLKPVIYFSIILLIMLLVSRIGLILWNIDRIDSFNVFTEILISGARIDLCLTAYLLLIPALLHPWLDLIFKNKIYWKRTLGTYLLLVFISVTFMELATPAFINEYGIRPNRLFIEYLNYPKEVSSMLFNGHIVTIILISIGLIFLSSIYLFIQSRVDYLNSPNIYSACIAFCIILILIPLSARGTLGHRPINPSLVYFSTDPLVNSLTLNSAYSTLHAYIQLDHEKDAAKVYGHMPQEKIIKTVRHSTNLSKKEFVSNKYPSMTSRSPTYNGKPKNLVIILEESLGAQFVSSLGGLPLTPEIDKLSKEGWVFKNLFATGTRSVRGIEAVITGFTPTPARSVVKLDKSQTGFFTIASLLKKNNYETQFIYGGESHFDNMKGFFLGNGFSDIVDFDDIINPKFVASWGASDEDLFTQADIELAKLNNSDKPFFSLIFSSSNHDPFEIPDNIITPISYNTKYTEKERMRHKAIQYADYALGNFIAHAKKQTYWEDTVFLIVADHDARVHGANLVPIKNFHIPGLILNSGKEHLIDERVVSHIDLAPTLLSLIGVENRSPMLGHDLNLKESGGRAIMQYSDNFAYMNNNDVVILQPHKNPLNFTYNFLNLKLSPSTSNKRLEKIALAHALWGSLAYKNSWHTSEQESHIVN